MKLLSHRQPGPRTATNATVKSIASQLLHELFEKQAQKTPQQIAVVSGNVRLTYSELTQISRKLGWQLRNMGAKPNSLVAIVMEKGWEQIAAALSILQSGAAYVPIDSSLPTQRLFQLLKNTEADLVLTQPGLNEALVWPSDIQKLSVVRETDQSGLERPLDSVQTADDLAYVIYTSGSTGLPKGVMIDHRGAVNTILDLNERFGVSPRDKILALSSLSFDLSVYDVFGMLAAGGTIVIPEASASRDPARWAELTQREAVTLWNSVPALMEMFVEYVSGRTEKLPPSLRLVMLSGDWIPLTLPNQIKAMANKIQLISLGGATEASIWSILYQIENVDPSWKSIPYGRPMVNQSFYVLNGLLEPCPVCVSGQLYIGGIGVAKGYWRDPEKTAAKFIIHPRTGERLYQTGDLGRYYPDGNIEFLGREDFQVKIRGFRIELGEIEAAISLHPEVRSVVVTAIGKTTTERRLAAYIVPERERAAILPGENLATGPAGFKAGIKDFLAEKLPSHMVPSVIVLLDALPLTPNGKVDHRSLPEPDHVNSNQVDDHVRPCTEVEKALAGIFKEVLQLDKVGIHDDFFALGGDSVRAIQLVSRANKQGYPLRPIMVFRHPTVAKLTEKVGEPSQPELIKFQTGDLGPELIFVIHDGSLGLLNLAHLIDKEFSLYASVVPIARSMLNAATTNRLTDLPTLEELAMEHVSLIKKRQTKRPVILVGHCFGGLLAFEIAHQLQKAREQVEGVVMLNTWMKQPPLWWRKKSWLQFHVGKLMKQGPLYLWQKIERRINLKKADLVSTQELTATFDFGGHVPTIIWDIYLQVAASYRPQVLSGRGVLLVSKDDWESNAYRQMDKTMGAGQWFTDGVEVSDVAGDHESVFTEPYLRELAGRCKTVLKNLTEISNQDLSINNTEKCPIGE